MKKQKVVTVADMFLREIVEIEPNIGDTVNYQYTAGENAEKTPAYPSFGALFQEIVDEVKNEKGDINTI